MATKAKKRTPATATPKAQTAKAATPAAVTADNRKIQVLVTENPKRGKSRERFALYKSGSTVAEYVARSVKTGNPVSLVRADLRWDEAKKLIAVG